MSPKFRRTEILKYLSFKFCFRIIRSHVRVYCPSVRPSRHSAVNINITVIKEIYFHEPLIVGIRHIVVTFTIL